MNTYVVLIKYTAKGMEKITGSPDRADAFLAHLKSVGCQLREVLWTFGSHDGVLIFDAPDELTAHKAILALAQGRNVATETLRAYDREGFGSLVANLDG